MARRNYQPKNYKKYSLGFWDLVGLGFHGLKDAFEESAHISISRSQILCEANISIAKRRVEGEKIESLIPKINIQNPKANHYLYSNIKKCSERFSLERFLNPKFNAYDPKNKCQQSMSL